MFSTHQRLSQARLAQLRSSNSEYAALLDTEVGGYLLDAVGDPDVLKYWSFHLATAEQAREDDEAPGARAHATGFDCIHATTPSDLDEKMDILSCLVLRTPHSWWVADDQGEPNGNFDTLAERINDSVSWSNYGWLHYGPGDKCTKFPDGPVPSCNKHDVAFASLQHFDGIPNLDGTPNSDELDKAWNPRNKYLADIRFWLDIKTYGCQNASLSATLTICDRHPAVLADWMHFAVAKINHKGWPVTSQDIQDAHAGGSNAEFRTCASPTLPTIHGLNITEHELSPSSYSTTLTWSFQAGCIVGLSDVEFRILPPFVMQQIVDQSVCSPQTKTGLATCSYTIPKRLWGYWYFDLLPTDAEYGPLQYPDTIIIYFRPQT